MVAPQHTARRSSLAAASAPLIAATLIASVLIVSALGNETLCTQGAPRPPRPADHAPLGGLGCEGEIVADASFGCGFQIAALEAGGAAERADLRVHDVILKLGGRGLPKKGDLILGLERQVEAAEAGKTGRLAALIWRDGRRSTVTLEVERLGGHSATCPVRCEKCGAVRDRAVAWLVQQQTKSGGWHTGLGGNNGLVVVSTLGGLALEGAGGHQKAVRRAAEYVAKACGAPDRFEQLRAQRGGPNWSQVNWPLGYAPLLLTAFPQDRSMREKLSEIAAKLVRNQESTGGYAHGPGGPNALDYLELEIVSNYALASIGLLRGAGIPVDDAGVDRALAYVRSCTSGDGGVAYSTRPGQAGHGDPGRTAGAYFAFYRNGLGRSKAARRMLKFFVRGMERLPTGHVSPMMHILAGAMACRASGQSKLMKSFWKTYRPYIMSSRLHAGSFAGRPTRESRAIRSNTDRTLGPAWATATYVIVMNMMMDTAAYERWFRGARKHKNGDK